MQHAYTNGSKRAIDCTRGVEIELEGDLVALLSLGLGANAATAGAAGASGFREKMRSVEVGCGGGIWPLPNIVLVLRNRTQAHHNAYE